MGDRDFFEGDLESITTCVIAMIYEKSGGLGDVSKRVKKGKNG